MDPVNHADRVVDRAGPLFLESFKTAIDSGKNALQTAILINGGAAVALLAFLGNILTKDTPSRASLKFPLSAALLCFGLGVLASALAAAFVYFAQSAHARQVEVNVNSIEASRAGKDTEAADLLQNAKAYHRTGLRRNLVAIWFGVASLVFFFAGLCWAFCAFWAMP